MSALTIDSVTQELREAFKKEEAGERLKLKMAAIVTSFVDTLAKLSMNSWKTLFVEGLDEEIETNVNEAYGKFTERTDEATNVYHVVKSLKKVRSVLMGLGVKLFDATNDSPKRNEDRVRELGIEIVRGYHELKKSSKLHGEKGVWGKRICLPGTYKATFPFAHAEPEEGEREAVQLYMDDLSDGEGEDVDEADMGEVPIEFEEKTRQATLKLVREQVKKVKRELEVLHQKEAEAESKVTQAKRARLNRELRDQRKVLLGEMFFPAKTNKALDFEDCTDACKLFADLFHKKHKDSNLCRAINENLKTIETKDDSIREYIRKFDGDCSDAEDETTEGEGVDNTSGFVDKSLTESDENSDGGHESDQCEEA